MKSYRNPGRLGLAVLALLCVAASVPSSSWSGRFAEAHSAIEAALYRAMDMPGGAVLFRRPPREGRERLTALLQSKPSAELYALRAMEDERQLDFAAAEADWKEYRQHAEDKTGAELTLADYYQRRLQPRQEIAALLEVAQAPPGTNEQLIAPAQQRSWRSFERILRVMEEQALPDDQALPIYQAWRSRYPQEAAVDERAFNFMISHVQYENASALISEYEKQFPNDKVFPVKARAQLALKQSSVQAGLEVYERSFQPLWPAELVKAYFDLLNTTQQARAASERWRAALSANPDDLNSAARLFYQQQQKGRTDAAAQVFTKYRLSKESRHAPWTADELYTLAKLLQELHVYPESARYYYALYSLPNASGAAQEKALAGLATILMAAPEQPIRLGAPDLSMYQEIATMDPGPGYWNGILSLLLNSQAPASQYRAEQERDVPYAHRAKAAELVALFEQKFPRSEMLAQLRSEVIETYAFYGESEAVIKSGRGFLDTMPDAPQHVAVGLRMADAYARLQQPQNEYAIYDELLKRLAAGAQGVPIGEPKEDSGTDEAGTPTIPDEFAARTPVAPEAGKARSSEYSLVLERYLSRLSAAHQVPQAVALLRREIERNPNDPGLYERLAQYLQQNEIGSEEEAVYKLAMQRFPGHGWYDKLARFYLRTKKQAAFAQLTRDAVKTFNGSDLEAYFSNVVSGTPELVMQLNRYAHERFPHDLVFVRNLLAAYHSKPTYNDAAWRELLRQHWFEAADLRNEYFESLSKSGQLSDVMAELKAPNNSAALTMLAEANMWRSHFEASAPAMQALAAEYPADTDLGMRASDVLRSVAAYQPALLNQSAAIAKNLVLAMPTDRERLARVGDIYADQSRFAEASPYWLRMAEIAPGERGGYLDSATVFWDYFDFDAALAVLQRGREQFKDPALYSYEEGAIYEAKRDYAKAIAEYARAAEKQPESESAQRLYALVKRPATQAIVEQVTKDAVSGNASTPSAVRLRVGVLIAENKQAEAHALLLHLVDQGRSVEEVEALGAIAQEHSLESVRERVLQREVDLNADPVRKLELRLELTRLLEGRQDVPAARAVIEAVYREDPKLLGVVRSTVDFDWRTNARPRAIEVLLTAARDSYPRLQQQFTLEAAQKLTETGDYARARELLTGLLQQQPFQAQYLAAMAATYAKANDFAGLRAFYQSTIAALQQASMPGDRKTERTAELRRAMVPALTRLKDYASAVDQYIELLNRFPEDEALASEAALYAAHNNQRMKLVSYYEKTVAASPKDFRWPLVLARLQTTFEDYPAAVGDWGKAIQIRPDRIDFRIARATLNERLQKIDAAIEDYQKLYDLTYHDPQWMLKVAEDRARQGREEECVAALRRAYIDGKPELPAKYFVVADKLESWLFLSSAMKYAEQGAKLAGNDLLALTENHAGARTLARLLTRARKPEEAYQRLTAMDTTIAKSRPIERLGQQVSTNGIAAITDSEWRQRQQRVREETAQAGLTAAIREAGETVKVYYTPEEKGKLVEFLRAKLLQDSGHLEEQQAMAEAAGLEELNVKLLATLADRLPENDHGAFQKLVALQRSRLSYAELGAQAEAHAKANLSAAQRDALLLLAQEAYRSAGDANSELRILNSLHEEQELAGASFQRWMQLLLLKDPQRLIQLAANSDQAAQFAVTNGDEKIATAAVASRGGRLGDVWNLAYVSLVNLYFEQTGQTANRDFLALLDDSSIGARLAQASQHKERLSGAIWFYYGGRYGEFRTLSPNGDPEDYLPSTLEASPGNWNSYAQLGRFLAEKGETKKSLDEYQRALELNPNSPAIQNDIAGQLWLQSKRTQAIAHWNAALMLLQSQVALMRVPESFWPDYAAVLNAIGRHGLYTEFKPQIDLLLRSYVRKNGEYRSDELLHSTYAASNSSKQNIDWVIGLTAISPAPENFLRSLIAATWIAPREKLSVYEALIELMKKKLDAASEPQERQYAQEQLIALQLKWIEGLLQTGQIERAQTTYAALPLSLRKQTGEANVRVKVELAVQRSALEDLIVEWKSDAERAPSMDVLRTVATGVAKNNAPASRSLLAFAYERALEQREFTMSNFLALADIRLQTDNLPEALALLRRMGMLVDSPEGTTYKEAAALLQRHGHAAEAVPFLNMEVASAPWNSRARLALAQAMMQTGESSSVSDKRLLAIAADGQAAYDLRAEAASLIKNYGGELRASELALLAQGSISPQQAQKPFYYPARVKAASSAQAAAQKVALLKAAIAERPASETAMLPLFHAAISSKQYRLALQAINPLIQRGLLGPTYQYPVNESEESGVEGTPLPQEQNVNERGGPSTEHAKLAEDIAEAMAHVSRLRESLGYFRRARQLEADSTGKKRLAARIQVIQQMIHRDTVNRNRAPEIHKDLDQPRLVRPKLQALAEVAP